MTRTRIGGRTNYQQLAEFFRPHDPALLAREARALAAQGLHPRDVGAALGVSEAAARELLQQPHGD